LASNNNRYIRTTESRLNENNVIIKMLCNSVKLKQMLKRLLSMKTCLNV